MNNKICESHEATARCACLMNCLAKLLVPVLLISIIGIIVIIVLMFCGIHWCYFGSISENIAALLACIGLVYSYCEYNEHKNQHKYSVLAEYNKRYMEDPSIKVVVNALIAHMDHHEYQMPSINERELFMRFYEELQLQIDSKLISKEESKYFFAYYAIAFNLIQDFHKGLDYNEDEEEKSFWENFDQYVHDNEYKSIESKIKLQLNNL